MGVMAAKITTKKLDGLKITQIITAVMGRESEIEKKIEQIGQEPDVYSVGCPGQTATSAATKQRYKARFDLNMGTDSLNVDITSDIDDGKYANIFDNNNNDISISNGNRKCKLVPNGYLLLEGK